ncbi:unnamed protein product [Kluyveromyces dobzhanskii CBS 2104]|uniref:Acyl-coenzyme A oxidase n=1 Tax=Kluyveromyces dobzhanskii CBS 2104 TaxID=1427455 RepID=A0A0A8LCG2_9SACH|nr:unnamed protein product [Kluyveromyces dobzhanskii CBS 2104]
MTRQSSVDQKQSTFNAKNFIAKERQQSRLDIDQLNVFLENGLEEAQLTRDLIEEIVNDPVLKTSTDHYDITKAQEREITARRIARLSLYMEHDVKTKQKDFKDDLVRSLQDKDSKLLTNRDLTTFDRRLSLVANIDPGLSTRIGVHLGLFGNCIKGNGTDEQIHYWLQEKGALLMKGIYGCFAMTELGHGSNVAQLQTIATYDPSSDTFRINTPDLLATKWWIGGAAHSATHTTVYARLIVNKKDYGVKTFVVPLREEKTFNLLPGVMIGDIGAKMGRDGIDNGWIQFKNVVIPRQFMLQRFTKVIPGSPPTVKTQPLLDQISGYSALLSGRVNMVMDSFRFGSKFAIIATRYAVGRQQFGPEGNETQLIDYPLHQYRVLPQLALCYLVAPTAHKLMGTYIQTLMELHQAGADKAKLISVSNKLKDLFIDSASLKATNTWLVAKLIDDLRQTCGGHGYSSYNGFGKGYNDWVVQCTWEGDNNILSLTSAKSIVKKFADISRGKKITVTTDSLQYLTPQFIAKSLSKSLAFKFDKPNDYTEIWAVMIIRLIHHVVDLISKGNKIDSLSKTLVQISKFHAIHSMLLTYQDKLNNDSEGMVKDVYTKQYLWKMYELFSLYFIDQHLGEFLLLKVVTSEQMSQELQPKLLQLLPEIRKECIALTDAFKLPDPMINAPIGYYDGDIYHNYFNEVTNNNKLEPDGAGKPPYYPLLTSMLGREDFQSRLGDSYNTDTLDSLIK